MAKFFKIQKDKFSIQILKTKFSNLSCGINFFPRPEVAKFIKKLQILLIYP
jgi:hypothetical protein